MIDKSMLLALLTAFLCPGSKATSEIMLSTVINDNMVIQGKQKLPIWGWAEPGEKVTVSFNNREKTAIADDVFCWKVEFEPMDYARTPLTMHITGSSGDAITFENILIGEVWIGAGQGNMAFPLQRSARGQEFIAKASDPLIRLYSIQNRASALPQITCTSSEWTPCSPEAVSGFSAVLYYFGLQLRHDLDVPVGLILLSHGGCIRGWIPVQGFRKQKNNKAFQANADTTGKVMNRSSARLLKDLRAFNVNVWSGMNKALAGKGRTLVYPPFLSVSDQRPFNAMVNPLIPYAVKGVLWYQGEHDVRYDNRTGLYFNCMKALIEGWRECWQQGSLPFYFVQLAPRDYLRRTNNPLSLPELWENQVKSLSIPATGMASTFDVSPVEGRYPEKGDPERKYEVGCRLALIALAKDYGAKDLVYSGPVYKSHEVERNAIRVSFDHVGGGLRSRNQQPLNWFAIAGQDQPFVKADAEINHDTVIVSSPDIAEPVAVRFGWHQLAVPNLMNKEGLPALPFRTDQWEGRGNGTPGK